MAYDTYSDTIDDGGGEDQKKSKYNSAISQLYRMDNLFQRATEHSIKIQYSRLNEVLDRLWLELYVRAKPETKERMIKIDEKLKALAIFGISEKLKIRNPVLYSKIMNAQRDLLQQKEKEIRSCQEDQGKGGVYEDDLMDYMD